MIGCSYHKVLSAVITGLAIFFITGYKTVLAQSSPQPLTEQNKNDKHIQAKVFPLWPGGAPGALGTSENDIPTLTVYLPDPNKATGSAMLVCPGGGYAILSNHEGQGYAQWLNQRGISCFVLKYRLGTHDYHHPCMFQDVTRAMRMIRASAAEWHIDPNRIGVIGSSAGGHLAATLLTHFDNGNPQAVDIIERQSSRPTIGILCYPVITMRENTHKGSRHYLIGDNPSPDLVDLLSNELHVTKDTPPCFIWHTWEDEAVKVGNSLDFALALQKAGVPYDLHIYQKGEHGIGLGAGPFEPDDMHPWTIDCMFWLKAQGFLKRND